MYVKKYIHKPKSKPTSFTFKYLEYIYHKIVFYLSHLFVLLYTKSALGDFFFAKASCWGPADVTVAQRLEIDAVQVGNLDHDRVGVFFETKSIDGVLMVQPKSRFNF